MPHKFPESGATDELSLRVSVATLVRVLLENPHTGDLMLALERRATGLEREEGHIVDVKSQPFGGAMRLLDPAALQKRISEFHFDSEEACSEQDFRIFIRPSDWETVREFCLEHVPQPNDPVLETDPTRELIEEFADTLGIGLNQDQYIFRPVGTIVEDQPSATENIHARGYPTARIYRIFESHILDTSLAAAMIRTSESSSDDELRGLARKDFQNGGNGRMNSVLTLPYSELSTFYLTIPLAARGKPISFHDHQLDETVAVVLDHVIVPKYRRL